MQVQFGNRAIAPTFGQQSPQKPVRFGIFGDIFGKKTEKAENAGEELENKKEKGTSIFGKAGAFIAGGFQLSLAGIIASPIVLNFLRHRDQAISKMIEGFKKSGMLMKGIKVAGLVTIGFLLFKGISNFAKLFGQGFGDGIFSKVTDTFKNLEQQTRSESQGDSLEQSKA